MLAPKNIIVVGGNGAGPAAAAKAKRIAPNCNIVMFEAGGFISTGTCELPYVLSGEIKDYKNIIFFDPQSFEKEKGVKVLINHLVELIDRSNKKIIVRNLISNQTFHQYYDRLILATGSCAKKLTNIKGEPLNLFTLKTVKDLLLIKNYLSKNPVRKILIIGGGYIGLESSEAFKTLGYDVTMIDKENLPMPGVDEELRYLISDLISKNKIEFSGSVKEIKFGYKGEKIITATFNGYTKEFDLVLLALGFEPNNSLAVSSKLSIGKYGGLRVDQKLKTSDPNIYAAGDNIEVINKITGQNDYIPLATYAQQMGHIAGENAAGGNSVARPIVKNVVVKIFDKYLVSVGLSSAEASEYKFNFISVKGIAPNLIKVMPGSDNVFGKLLVEKSSRKIIGGFFLGGKEVSGYGDLIATFISNKIKAGELEKINYNYSPPISPFINILSILGRKLEKELS
jgi:NADPH-dependent 2,4-dienoyl-CoA reductase/sulfur reductase-like enzyme